MKINNLLFSKSVSCMTDKGIPIVRSYANNFQIFYGFEYIDTNVCVCNDGRKRLLLSPRCQSYLLQTTW